ncbi:UNVERIFIED_CONTAM: hypothetical protein Q9R58_22005 [Methylobacteriaceae bacterium AG10]|nr:hypothetical protein [Methylobacteriaceae bacterium AG10]
MERFIRSIEQSLATSNWYSALALALTLPDMCAFAEKGSKVSGNDYAKWFDRWVAPKYVSDQRVAMSMLKDLDQKSDGKQGILASIKEVFGDKIDDGFIPFLSGKDCYALRCAYLHNASDDISDQTKQDVLHKFCFFYPDGFIEMHNCPIPDENQNRLALQVNIFCKDICSAVQSWTDEMMRDGAEIDTSRLIEIKPSSALF